MDRQPNESPVHKPTVVEATVTRKTLYITILVAIILLVALWAWKAIETNKIRKNAETEQNNLKTEAEGYIVQTHEQHLRLLAKPFVWAVRSQMLEGNMSQVNLYMNEMVKEKNFQRISLVDAQGKIISSTNKKDERQAFATIGNDADLSNDQTNVQVLQDSVIHLTSPVMGFNNRLGTLVISYNIPKTTFKNDSTATVK